VLETVEAGIPDPSFFFLSALSLLPFLNSASRGGRGLRRLATGRGDPLCRLPPSPLSPSPPFPSPSFLFQSRVTSFLWEYKKVVDVRKSPRWFWISPPPPLSPSFSSFFFSFFSLPPPRVSTDAERRCVCWRAW